MFEAFVAGARAVATEVSRAADALETRGADDAERDDATRAPPLAERDRARGRADDARWKRTRDV